MIFVDTSFWVALRQRNDDHHADAVALWPRYADAALLTTSQVRGETWTFLRRRSGHSAAVEFLDALERSARVRVHFVDEDLERKALRWLRTHDEREYSFVDATSFATMRATRTTEALAFDGDFAAAGFVELRP
ncbi:MAG: type II toxin-antitoxin system VapC family toxin [Sporichthyaceae bacterium]